MFSAVHYRPVEVSPAFEFALQPFGLMLSVELVVAVTVSPAFLLGVLVADGCTIVVVFVVGAIVIVVVLVVVGGI